MTLNRDAETYDGLPDIWRDLLKLRNAELRACRVRIVELEQALAETPCVGLSTRPGLPPTKERLSVPTV